MASLSSRTRSFVPSLRASLRELLGHDLLPRRAQHVVLALIVLCTLVVRLDRIDAPALDRTQWKEIDYLMISQGYLERGFQFLKPEIGWPAEEPRATAMELPLVPYASALLYAAFGVEPLPARATTLVSFLVLTVYVFLLVRRELGSAAGLLAAAVSAFAGLRHPFGHLQFSEPPMLACSVIAIHHMAQWMDGGRWRDAAVSCAAFSLAVALKLEPLYLGLPLAYLVWRRFGATPAAAGRFTGYVVAALVLPALWFSHAYHLATSSIDVFGVFGGSLGGGHDKFQTLTMLTSVSWHREMLSRMHSHLLSGWAELLMAVLGAGALVWLRQGALILVYLATIGLYCAIVAEGHLDAPYRQLAFIPPLSACVAVGFLVVAAALGTLTRTVQDMLPARRQGLLALVALGLLLFFDLRTPLPEADPERPAWAKGWAVSHEIRSHVKLGDRLVAAGQYSIHKGGNDLSPVLYHYTGLRGWTLQAPDWKRDRIDELMRRGATLFFASGMHREPESAPFIAEMKRSFPVLYEDDQGWLLLRLQEPPPLASDSVDPAIPKGAGPP